jgi:hypothetical protein
MRRSSWLIILAVIILLVFVPISVGSAQTPPDIIHSYVITIDPQTDGSLLMTYNFDYEAATDFTDEIPYVEIGVPNSDFEITDYGPKDFIKNAEKNISGGSWVHLDFYELPKEADRFNFYFTIEQNSMIYETDEGFGFKFIPGWFSFAEVSELKVILLTEGLEICSLEPEPVNDTNGEIFWITKDMVEDQKADPIIVVSDLNSYPDLTEEQLVSESGSVGGVVLIIFIVIIVLFLIIFFVVTIAGDDGYDGGGYGGGYHGGGFRGSGGTSSGSRFGGSGSASSGGSGSFSGRGSSCACVSSCACACACAGGGRVGCSERGFQVLHWIISKQKNDKAGDRKC